jgi:hypothetical protein
VVRGFGSERPNEKDELPPLFFVQPFFEGWHGLSTFADLVKELAIGDGVHPLGIVEARGSWVVQGGVRAVAFSGFAVALNAFIEVNGASGRDGGWGRLDGIFSKLGFFGDPPLAVLIHAHKDGYADDTEESGEDDFAQAESASRCGGHGQRNFRTPRWKTEERKALTQILNQQ